MAEMSPSFERPNAESLPVALPHTEATERELAILARADNRVKTPANVDSNPGQMQGYTARRKLASAVIALGLMTGAGVENILAPSVADAATILCSGYSACNSAGYTDHGYGASSGNSYWGQDSGHNCTNYVAYVETQNGVARPNFFLGNAWQWYSEASGHFPESTTTPVVGSVAWYGQNQGGVGSDGHAAYVEAVSGSAGNYTIEISEDAYPSGPYDWMSIQEGTSRWPGGFIYFDNLTPPPPPPPAPNDTLYFIKTQDTGSGTIEIHDAISAGAYQTADLHTTTYFNEADGPNGTWQMWHRNLYFIKTANTAGTIEVHDATAASNYQAADVHSTTPFNEADAGNGEWQMADINHDNIPDLVFIKERNTISGHVEVFVSYGPSYSQIDIGEPTAFSPTDATNGHFQIENADLYYIKTQNTGTNSVELFRAPIGLNYQTITEATGTLFNMTDPTNGIFSVEDMYNGGSPELVYIKTQNTDQGIVEIFAANNTNLQQLALATTTYFGEDNGPNGTWEMADGS